MKGQRKRLPSSPLVAPLSSSTAPPRAKKHKVSSRPAVGPAEPQTPSTNGDVNVMESVGPVGDPGWIKVERHKAKKVRKMEARMDNPTNNGVVPRSWGKKSVKVVLNGQLVDTPPRFFYVNGEILKRKEAVNISDIRDLVLHLLGDASPLPWLKVENPRSICKVVALFVPGISHEDLNLPPLPTSATQNPNLPIGIPLPAPPSLCLAQSLHPAPQRVFEPLYALYPFTDCIPSPLECKVPIAVRKPRNPEDVEMIPLLPFIMRTFSHACPTRAPGEPTKMHSTMSAFFQIAVHSDVKKKRAIERVPSGASSANPDQFLLTPEQMLANEYPIPSYLSSGSSLVMDSYASIQTEGWAETPQPDTMIDLDVGRTEAPISQRHRNAKAKVYAIDCEMCLTEEGKELTRVCMIDYETEQVVMDSLVRPLRPITNYLTRWSGITSKALEGVTTSLADVQRDVLSIIAAEMQPTSILLGHSLESDLRALKLRHSACIDTALLYHHPRGRPMKPGLAWLVRKWCNREIQTRGEGGHDPEEDARACLELLKLKIHSGPGFGEFKVDLESIFERLSRSSKLIRTAVVDRGNPGTWHGAHATTVIPCQDDFEALESMIDCIPDHEFIFGRFMELAESLGWTTPKVLGGRQEEADTLNAVTTAAVTSSSQSSEDARRLLNGRLATLHASLPSGTAMILFTGHSDPRVMASLNNRKTAFENALRAGRKAEEMDRAMWWTIADGRALEEAVEKAKRGLLFLCLKE